MKKGLLRMWIRWRLASGETLPEWLQRACQRDADLRRELELERSLSERLRGDAARDERSVATPVGSLERAMEAVHREEGRGRRRRGESFFGNWRPRLALAAVAAVALAVALVLFDGGERGQPLAEQPEKAMPLAEEAPLAINVKNILDTDWKNPLDQEFEYLLADGKRAVDFVIGNFSPEKKERG